MAGRSMKLKCQISNEDNTCSPFSEKKIKKNKTSSQTFMIQMHIFSENRYCNIKYDEIHHEMF